MSQIPVSIPLDADLAKRLKARVRAAGFLWDCLPMTIRLQMVLPLLQEQAVREQPLVEHYV